MVNAGRVDRIQIFDRGVDVADLAGAEDITFIMGHSISSPKADSDLIAAVGHDARSVVLDEYVSHAHADVARPLRGDPATIHFNANLLEVS